MPTWDDCQQILQTLFTSEERERIYQEAAKAVLGDGDGDVATRPQELEDQLPTAPLPRIGTPTLLGGERLYSSTPGTCFGV